MKTGPLEKGNQEQVFTWRPSCSFEYQHFVYGSHILALVSAVATFLNCLDYDRDHDGLNLSLPRLYPLTLLSDSPAENPGLAIFSRSTCSLQSDSSPREIASPAEG